MSHVETIEAYFREHPPTTIPEALEKIEELTQSHRTALEVRQIEILLSDRY